MISDIKTIDIQTREWCDKTYGNTYFSARVTLDYGMSTERGFSIPFQYGYGEHCHNTVLKKLFPDAPAWEALSTHCRGKGIILRSNKADAKKREAKAWGECEFQNPV